MTDIILNRKNPWRSETASIWSSPVESIASAMPSEMAGFAARINQLQMEPSPATLPVTANAQTTAERLFDATASAKILASRVAMYLTEDQRRKIFRQLDSIHDVNEWDEDDKPIRKTSFATFLKALLVLSPQRHPGMALSQEGNLIAAWIIGVDRLTMEFLPGDRVRWVVSMTISGEKERATGDVTISRLGECLMPYRPEHWFTRG